MRSSLERLMGSPESKTPAARAASGVWELAQLLKSQDSLGSIQGPTPPAAPQYNKGEGAISTDAARVLPLWKPVG